MIDFGRLSKTTNPNPFRRRRVLAIDDDSDILMLLGELLADLPCDLTTASDGLEGLRKFVEEPPDLVLLDIDMPVVGGLEILRRLRGHRQSSQVPVIIISALASTMKPQVEELSLGVAAYFNKPFFTERLRESIAGRLGLEDELDAVHREASLRVEAERVFAGFEMIDRIRSDAISTTWRVRQKSLDRVVALKVVTEEASRRPEVHQAIQSQAKVFARIAHPNIFQMYEFGRTEFIHYAAFQHIDGVRLSDILNGGPLSIEPTVRIWRSLQRGVAGFHAEGVTIFNLRPAAIVIDIKGELKIADFGVTSDSKAPNDRPLVEVPDIPRPSSYLAWEQKKPEMEITYRVDIFAAASIVFEMLAGRPHDPVMIVADELPDVSPAFVKLLEAALSIDFEQRPDSITDFGNRLEKELLEMLPLHEQSRMKKAEANSLRSIARPFRRG